MFIGTALLPFIRTLFNSWMVTEAFQVYSMVSRYDMGNLGLCNADGHKDTVEFQNVGPVFELAMDVSYLPSRTCS